MTPEQWARVRTVFHELVDLAPTERPPLLHELAAAEPEIHAEVTSLLAAHDQPSAFTLALEAPSATAEVPPEWLGRRIGAYRVEQVLGRGGMGVAYLARDERLGRHVTIKAVSPGLRDADTRRVRLEREAQAAAMLSHPGIAAVYALEQVDGQAFIVSEYVPGKTLREVLAEGPLPLDRALHVLRQLARGLEAAHERGIVHRDLKPENIIVRDDGVVKVLDFGLAVIQVDGDQPTVQVPRLTASGIVVGTPAYMAPEQLAGHAVDARSDLYAFGVVAFEAVTGQHPFAERSGSPHAAFDREPWGPQLRGIVERCLEAMPNRRFDSAREVAEALDQLDGPPRAAATTQPEARHSGAVAASSEALWWWQAHQAVVSGLYVLAVGLGWNARTWLGTWANPAFLVAVVIASVGVSYRCHLWFVSVFHVNELGDARRSAGSWLKGVDVLLALALGVASATLARGHEVRAAVMAAVAVSTLVAAWRIEPLTALAAFGKGHPEPASRSTD